MVAGLLALRAGILRGRVRERKYFLGGAGSRSRAVGTFIDNHDTYQLAIAAGPRHASRNEAWTLRKLAVTFDSSVKLDSGRRLLWQQRSGVKADQTDSLSLNGLRGFERLRFDLDAPGRANRLPLGLCWALRRKEKRAAWFCNAS